MKRTFRNSIDLTPWDKTGNSFMGLNKYQSKKIASPLIFLSLWLMFPPIIPDPSDIINIWFGKLLNVYLGIDPLISLVLAFTVIPWSLFLLGLYIYPHNTKSMFNGYITKLKLAIKRFSKRPLLIIVAIVIFYYVFKWYESILIGGII